MCIGWAEGVQRERRKMFYTRFPIRSLFHISARDIYLCNESYSLFVFAPRSIIKNKPTWDSENKADMFGSISTTRGSTSVGLTTSCVLCYTLMGLCVFSGWLLLGYIPVGLLQTSWLCWLLKQFYQYYSSMCAAMLLVLDICRSSYIQFRSINIISCVQLILRN